MFETDRKIKKEDDFLNELEGFVDYIRTVETRIGNTVEKVIELQNNLSNKVEDLLTKPSVEHDILDKVRGLYDLITNHFNYTNKKIGVQSSPSSHSNLEARDLESISEKGAIKALSQIKEIDEKWNMIQKLKGVLNTEKALPIPAVIDDDDDDDDINTIPSTKKEDLLAYYFTPVTIEALKKIDITTIDALLRTKKKEDKKCFFFI